MPRSTLRGSGEPLLALSDGLNERALRAAASRDSQQGVDVDVAEVEDVERVNVGGILFQAFANPAAAAAAGVNAGHHAGDPVAAADAAQDGSLASTEEQLSAIEASVDEDVDAAALDEAVVDGRLAGDEDAAEYEAAEEVANEASVQAAAAAAQRPVSGASRRVSFAPAHAGKAPRGMAAFGMGGAKRHSRKVLRCAHS